MTSRVKTITKLVSEQEADINRLEGNVTKLYNAGQTLMWFLVALQEGKTAQAKDEKRIRKAVKIFNGPRPL